MARESLPETGPLEEAQQEVLRQEAALHDARVRRDRMIQDWMAKHDPDGVRRWQRALARVLGLSPSAFRAALTRRLDDPRA